MAHTNKLIILITGLVVVALLALVINSNHQLAIAQQKAAEVAAAQKKAADDARAAAEEQEALARERENAERERVKTNIESVLTQDAQTIYGVQTAGEVVSRMRDIDTSGCPADFREAYLAHIHAWESMVEVEKNASAFNKEANSDSTFVEALIRGMLGDPHGKANEISEAQTQLQRDYKEAHSAIKQTFNQVEETAVLYGATLPR